MMRNRLLVAVVALLLCPSAGAAQNREHLQQSAELRILQEHVSRLQLSVNRLDAELTETNKRLDAATNATVKGFADQQLLINQLGATLSSVRERLDDNSVRVSQMSQEFTAIREGVRRLTEQINALVGLIQPAVDAAAPTSSVTPPSATSPSSPVGSSGSPAAGGPAAGGTSAASAGLSPVVIPQSPTYVYEQAAGDYRSGRFDGAIEGFREVITAYPDSPAAANAQFQIGESFYYGKNDCKSALPEYQKFVDTYKESDRRPDGLFMVGVCSLDLNQRTNAQRAFQQTIKEYPNSSSAILSAQRLQSMGVKPQ